MFSIIHVNSSFVGLVLGLFELISIFYDCEKYES